MSDYLDRLDPGKVGTALARMRETAPEKIKAAGGNERLALYLAGVDLVLVKKFGITHDSLTDWNWFDAFAEDVAPRDAAKEAVENDGLFTW